jgi:hypothetical protein
MTDAFYVPDGQHFAATELTRGPWDPDAQHAGPPAALLGRALELAPGGDGKQVARITFEILQPLPIAPLEVTTEVLRPGRRVDLVSATLTADGQPLMLARAWRFTTGHVEVPEAAVAAPAPPGPVEASERPFFPTGQDTGYHTAMEFLFVRGGFLDPGPATVWMRTRAAIVAGEPPSPLARVLVAADSGNGVSAALDPTTHLFVNTDLTVHLHRLPASEWVCLDARTTIDAAGIGLAEAALYDEAGTIGRSLQSLHVAPRQ